MRESGDWFLLHDNAPSHNATIIKQFLAQRKVTVLDHPHPESRDKYIKHHCKRRLLQRHPEAVWPCKSLCTVRRDVCRKLINKSVISSTQILFIMPVLKLSRRTVYSKVVLRNWPILQYLLWCICRSTYRKSLYRLKAKNNFSTWTTLWKISFADVDSK